jgi:hypothetical protein
MGEGRVRVKYRDNVFAFPGLTDKACARPFTGSRRLENRFKAASFLPILILSP